MQINNSINLQMLELKHADELFDAVSLSRRNLAIYLPWVNGVTNIETAKDYISERIYREKVGSQWFAIYVDGLFSGVFAIKEIDNIVCVAQLGYWLADFARGKRVMPTVLNKMIPYIKANTAAKVVEFRCLEGNQTSIKVVKRVGAQFKGYQENTIALCGKEQLLGLYQIHLYENE